MLSGDPVISFLADEAQKADAGATSHWRKYHASFQYADGVLSGLEGFGGVRKPYTGLQKLAHRQLQARFRRMGQPFPDFPKLDEIAAGIAQRQEKEYGLDALRQTLTLSMLKHALPIFGASPTIAVIGDGFAALSSLIYASTNARIVLVNLTKTLLVDLLFFKRAFPNEPVALVQSLADVEATSSRVVAIMAKDYDLLRHFRIDLALNIVSMQEMDPATIAGYFAALRANTRWFYCCNREEKTLPDGTVTRFKDYPWSAKDTVIVDELCPWHQFYYAKRPPFYFQYDGPIRHRLARLL